MADLFLYNNDCLQIMKTLPSNSVDVIFTDPPYALGSEVIIREDGRPDYKNAKDFMNKWKMPSGDFWADWFFESNRILKFGGRIFMFGIDRQTFLFQYYAALNKFKTNQKLYWFFASNFPKATDLSKQIDKYFCLQRKEIGDYEHPQRLNRKSQYKGHKFETEKIIGKQKITEANHSIAKKYSGLKYSNAPLKQTCEEVMVFQKAFKTSGCLHDVLAFENGDLSITVSTFDIDNNRIEYKKDIDKKDAIAVRKNGQGIVYSNRNIKLTNCSNDGRYPSQTFVNSKAADILDAQSGVVKSSTVINENRTGIKKSYSGGLGEKGLNYGYNDVAGCSKILNKCDLDKEEHDIFIYNPKISPSERADSKHPTMKPEKLIEKILKLIKTPNKQTILDPFLGSGTIGKIAKKLNFDFIGIELNKEYFDFAKQRIKKTDNTLIFK